MPQFLVSFLSKRIVSILLLLYTSVFAVAQGANLNGSVIDAHTGEPLAYASVYFNSTTNGVTTDEEGKFSIRVNPSFTELIVSFLGYQTITYQVDATQLDKLYKFEMIMDENQLEEVEIVSKRSDKWYQNLASFTREFIGTSTLARKTKILNPEVLQFNYNERSNKFTASARKPLIIENKALGYQLEYDLRSYVHDYTTKRLIILGYPRFIEMEGGKGKKRRWKKARDKAFYGSYQHFLQSIYNQSVAEEGYEIRRLVRKPNPNRPDEESIAQAKEVMRTYALAGKMSEAPDSIRSVLKEARQSKMVSYLESGQHDYHSNIKMVDGDVHVEFSDYWQVTYTKEKEDSYYVPPGRLYDSNRKAQNQVSLISLKTDIAEINSAGVLRDPLSLLFEEYWAFEKIGDLLPLDYQPEPKN